MSVWPLKPRCTLFLFSQALIRLDLALPAAVLGLWVLGLWPRGLLFISGTVHVLPPSTPRSSSPSLFPSVRKTPLTGPRPLLPKPSGLPSFSSSVSPSWHGVMPVSLAGRSPPSPLHPRGRQNLAAHSEDTGRVIIPGLAGLHGAQEGGFMKDKEGFA